MKERLLGVETEYAINHLTARGQAMDRAVLLDRLLGLARQKLVHLPDCQAGMFLENGARFYVDCGLHPELTTPECATPAEVVRYIQAGERILDGLARQIEASHREPSEVYLFKCNVDYSGVFSTWGCHESYLHSTDPALLSRQILPHLVSRPVYTGAGGFNAMSAGLEFLLSPRVPFLERAVSHDSTRNRGIFHTKNESLSAAGYGRLHLLAGESLCSETATYLKVGTTALIVALIEAGRLPGEAVQLREPLEAMRAIARDPSLRHTASLAAGRWMTALGIQRHYLAQAEACLGSDFLPSWAEAVCQSWREILDRLENGRVEKRLDWAIKLALFQARARRRGIPWESFRDWNHIVSTLNAALEQTEYRHKSIPAEKVIGAESPVAPAVAALGPYLEQHGLTWDGLRPFLDLRLELLEIDLRFGRLGERGIFAALDREGVLEHRLPATEGPRVEEAVTSPPSAGRARLRSALIRRLSDVKPGRYCDWHQIVDTRENRILDLSNPFETEEKWQPIPKDSDELSSPLLQDWLGALRRRIVRPSEGAPRTGVQE